MVAKFFSCLYLHNLNFSHLFIFWIFFCSGFPRKHMLELDWSTRLSVLIHFAAVLVSLHHYINRPSYQVNHSSFYNWDIKTQRVFIYNGWDRTIVDFGPRPDYNDYIQDVDYTSVIEGKRYLFYWQIFLFIRLHNFLLSLCGIENNISHTHPITKVNRRAIEENNFTTLVLTCHVPAT